MAAIEHRIGRASWRAAAGAGLLVAIAVCAGCSSNSTSQSTATTSQPATTSASQGPATPATRPATADSCSVITRSEAGRALGRAVKPPIRGRATVEGGAACVFYGPGVPAQANPDLPLANSVRIVLVKGAQAKSFFADYRTRVSAQPVAGLGDQAYYDGYASLSVLKGSAYIRIAVIGVPDVLGAEKKLAAVALPRM